MANDRMYNNRGMRVSALIFDNGTCLAPGLMLRASRDRAHVLLKKGGEYVTETYRLHDWKSDYLALPGDTYDERLERAYRALAIELRAVNGRMPSMSGDESVSDPHGLEGRRVSAMLHNGICIIGATVRRVYWRDNALYIGYQRPDSDGESAIPLYGIGHLYVFGPKDDPSYQQFPAHWYAHLIPDMRD